MASDAQLVDGFVAEAELMAERISFHTGQGVDQIEVDSERDRWFTAEQAKAYGIVDNVIVKRGELL